MKKVINILVLILTSLLVISCIPYMDKNVVVIKITHSYENYCNYVIRTESTRVEFIDICNKFQVGDTIKLVKY